eukprot:TRINITY_DN19001_c0_g1_i2.p1 TRINITY_DN19001_c0_g1~~TRINITY_DN19001_c0_g1_i2.p1  ORF type:complete len:596 (+),score=113.94 TRINITY_DN19001_c0_g1_i2:102-1889(+)
MYDEHPDACQAMIRYAFGTWGVAFIFQITGSVFPKAISWAIPNTLLAVFLKLYVESNSDFVNNVDKIWSGYTFVLGFLVVFRNNQAYSRFWEGATLISQVRGEWFNTASSLISFTSAKPEKHDGVRHFQQLLVRLMSVLYCSALQQVCELEDDSLEIIDIRGLSAESIAYLSISHEPCEVVVQWIQRLIVEANREGTLDVPPPILSRSFQELSRGIVGLSNVRKLKEIPFPFPYAQMIQVMLMVHWLFTPWFAANLVNEAWVAGLITFLVTASLWSLIYIATEIDQPFGDDANDLHVDIMQQDFNKSLLSLLNPVVQIPPDFDFEEHEEHELAAPSMRRHHHFGKSEVDAQVEAELEQQPSFFNRHFSKITRGTFAWSERWKSSTRGRSSRSLRKSGARMSEAPAARNEARIKSTFGCQDTAIIKTALGGEESPRLCRSGDLAEIARLVSRGEARASRPSLTASLSSSRRLNVHVGKASREVLERRDGTDCGAADRCWSRDADVTLEGASPNPIPHLEFSAADETVRGSPGPRVSKLPLQPGVSPRSRDSAAGSEQRSSGYAPAPPNGDAAGNYCPFSGPVGQLQGRGQLEEASI